MCVCARVCVCVCVCVHARVCVCAEDSGGAVVARGRMDLAIPSAAGDHHVNLQLQLRAECWSGYMVQLHDCWSGYMHDCTAGQRRLDTHT